MNFVRWSGLHEICCQVINELRKVVWPSRNMLTTYTAVVLVFVTFVIAVVSLFDLGLTQLVLFIFGE